MPLFVFHFSGGQGIQGPPGDKGVKISDSDGWKYKVWFRGDEQMMRIEAQPYVQYTHQPQTICVTVCR
jgi:hypothetical protein